MNTCYVMAAQNVGIYFHSLGLGAQFVLWDLSFSLACTHQACADAKESEIVDIKANTQTWVLWQSTHAPLNKMHPPSKDKKIFKILGFVNIMAISEHHSMRLSSQVSFFCTGLFPT